VDAAGETRVEGGEVCGRISARARDVARIEADEAVSLPGEDDVEGVLGSREEAVDQGDLVRGCGAFLPFRDEGDSQHLPDQRPQARHHRGEGRDVAQEPEGRTAMSHARSIPPFPRCGTHASRTVGIDPHSALKSFGTR